MAQNHACQHTNPTNLFLVVLRTTHYGAISAHAARAAAVARRKHTKMLLPERAAVERFACCSAAIGPLHLRFALATVLRQLLYYFTLLQYFPTSRSIRSAMSSERFESHEFDVQEALGQIKSLCSQLANASGGKARMMMSSSTAECSSNSNDDVIISDTWVLKQNNSARCSPRSKSLLAMRMTMYVAIFEWGCRKREREREMRVF